MQLHVTQFTSRVVKRPNRRTSHDTRWAPENWIFSVNKSQFRERREYSVITEEKCNLNLKKKAKKNSFQFLFCFCLLHFPGCIYHLCSYENNEAVWIAVLFVCKEGTRTHSYKYETGGNPDDKAFQSFALFCGACLIVFLHFFRNQLHLSLFWANTLRHTQEKMHFGCTTGGTLRTPLCFK